MQKWFQSADSASLSTANAKELEKILNQNPQLISGQMAVNFYIVLNAVSDHRRSRETALVLIKQLYFKNSGGVNTLIASPVLRQKVYAPVLQRAIDFESDPQIKSALEELIAQYK